MRRAPRPGRCAASPPSSRGTLPRARRVGGASPTTWPSRIRTTRPARAATSASWVISTIVRPAACSSSSSAEHVGGRRASRGCRSARRPGSAPGSVTSARATATRCCWPPDSSPGRCSTRSPSPTRSSAATARSRRSCRGTPAYASGSSTLRQRRQRRQQVELLEDEADAPVADVGQLVLGHARRRPRRPAGRCPSVGTSRQPRMCISVDLPEPDGPMTATYSPRPISRLTPRSACHLERAAAVDLAHVAQRDRPGPALRRHLDERGGRHPLPPLLAPPVRVRRRHRSRHRRRRSRRRRSRRRRTRRRRSRRPPKPRPLPVPLPVPFPVPAAAVRTATDDRVAVGEAGQRPGSSRRS